MCAPARMAPGTGRLLLIGVQLFNYIQFCANRLRRVFCGCLYDRLLSIGQARVFNENIWSKSGTDVARRTEIVRPLARIIFHFMQF